MSANPEASFRYAFQRDLVTLYVVTLFGWGVMEFADDIAESYIPRGVFRGLVETTVFFIGLLMLVGGVVAVLHQSFRIPPDPIQKGRAGSRNSSGEIDDDCGATQCTKRDGGRHNRPNDARCYCDARCWKALSVFSPSGVSETNFCRPTFSTETYPRSFAGAMIWVSRRR